MPHGSRCVDLSMSISEVVSGLWLDSSMLSALFCTNGNVCDLFQSTVSTRTGIKQKTPHNNTLSRKPLKFSELVFDLILDLRDVLI